MKRPSPQRLAALLDPLQHDLPCIKGKRRPCQADRPVESRKDASHTGERSSLLRQRRSVPALTCRNTTRCARPMLPSSRRCCTRRSHGPRMPMPSSAGGGQHTANLGVLFRTARALLAVQSTSTANEPSKGARCHPRRSKQYVSSLGTSMLKWRWMSWWLEPAKWPRRGRKGIHSSARRKNRSR